MALSIEALNNLTPEQMADKTLEELDAEFGDGQPEDLEDDEDNNNNDDDQDEDDQNADEDNPDDDNQDDDHEQEDEDNPTDDNDDQDDDADNDDDHQEQEQEKAKQQDKTKDTNLSEEAALHKSFYDAITAPFTANGQQYQLKDPSDIISMVQKGLNYNLKMNTIKPFMQAGTLLQENGLLDTDKLAFLIDLHNKKPEAIAKLIQESGIDAYELDEEKANNYKATPVNIPSEQAIALREVIANNKDNSDFAAVYNTAMTWDDESQKTLADDPSLIEVLAQHKANGVYDKVMQEVNVAMNVRGDKTPVIQLYSRIGHSMFGNGQNANMAQAPKQEPASSTKQTKLTKRVDPRLEEKRKTLKSVKTAQKGNAAMDTSGMTEEDIYRLSPEEFNNISHHLLKGN